jgi:hypothetical protein
MENVLMENKLSVHALKRQAGAIQAAWDARNFMLALDFALSATEDLPQSQTKTGKKERIRFIADIGYIVGVAHEKEMSSIDLLGELLQRFETYIRNC